LKVLWAKESFKSAEAQFLFPNEVIELSRCVFCILKILREKEIETHH